MKNNNNNPSTNVFNSAAQVNTNSMNGPLNLTPAQLQEQEQLRIQHGLVIFYFNTNTLKLLFYFIMLN